MNKMVFTVFVEDNITDELINILEHLKNTNDGVDLNVTCTINGFQTNNICEELYMKKILNSLLEYLPRKDLNYRWFHMIDYNKNGSQKKHDHSKTEDFSFILYLSDCKNGGETLFETAKKNIKVKPEKNKLIFFPSNLWHEGLETIDRKKVAVGALKI